MYPVTAFHDPDVNSGSQRLVDAHSRNWPSKRILMQVIDEYKFKRPNSSVFSDVKMTRHLLANAPEQINGGHTRDDLVPDLNDDTEN